MSETKTAKRTGRSPAFTADERAAMKERVHELKGPGGESEVLAKIAQMAEPDRIMAERVHALLTTAAQLSPRTWYGMPAYAKDGNTICFFKPAQKFKARYATLGFTDKANLDDGAMWPTEFALTQLTAAEEALITELVERAVS